MPALKPKSPLRGRPPAEYRVWCQERTFDTTHQKAVTRVLTNDKHPHFATVTKHIHTMAFGAPIQQLQVEDTTPQKPMTGEAIVLRLLDALPLLLAGRPDLSPKLATQAALDAEFTVLE